jgi:hypothetical protein
MAVSRSDRSATAQIKIICSTSAGLRIARRRVNAPVSYANSSTRFDPPNNASKYGH